MGQPSPESRRFTVPHHPFRFGVNVYEANTRDKWITKAQHIEALGYDTFFVADHLGTFPPIAGMMAAATATTTLRIGSNVFANDFRHPLLLGREVAAVDLFSGGRLILGLGTGFWRADYDQSGIPLEPPSTRVGRLEEAILILKGIFTAAPFSFTGHHYTVRDFALSPVPVQQPHPPILVGGGGPRILALAAREADIVSFNMRTTRTGGFDPTSISPVATAQKVAWVRQAAGERLAQLEFSFIASCIAITDDREGTAEQLAEGWREAGVAIIAEQILESPTTLIGTVDEIVGNLRRAREQYGFSYIVIGDDQIDAFAPIVAQLSGT
jgi:probable F420-dependent oxidoreductase